MREPGPRVAYWMSAFCDLLQQPFASMPTGMVVDQLTATFRFSQVTYNWRDSDRRLGMEVWPHQLLVAHADIHAELLAGRLIDHHPLIRWFATTANPLPWTSGRVPTAMIPKGHRAEIHGVLRRIGAEQQLSISYRLSGVMHRAFVLGRDGRDFDDEDLVVAGYVQRALRALDYQINLLDGLKSSDRISKAIDVGLTGREIAVLELVGAGLSTRVIGRRLDCAPRTVEKHLERIYRKLGVADRLNAVRVARLAGIIDDDQSGQSQRRMLGAASA